MAIYLLLPLLQESGQIGNKSRSIRCAEDWLVPVWEEMRKELLQREVLHADGYAGYNKIPGVTRCGCWAHLRRKSVETMPQESSRPSPAQIGRDYCDQLLLLKKKSRAFCLNSGRNSAL